MKKTMYKLLAAMMLLGCFAFGGCMIRVDKECDCLSSRDKELMAKLIEKQMEMRNERMQQDDCEDMP